MPRATCATPPARCTADTRPRRWPLLAAAALLPLVWAGCAQNAWRPDPNASDFANRVSQNCGSLRLGELQIRDLMSAGSMQASPVFMDLSSRYGSGRISEQDYVSGLTGTFRTTADSEAVRCLLAQKAGS